MAKKKPEKKRGRGRPSKGLTERFAHFTMSSELGDQVERAANKAKIKIAEWWRNAAAEKLRRDANREVLEPLFSPPYSNPGIK